MDVLIAVAAYLVFVAVVCAFGYLSRSHFPPT